MNRSTTFAAVCAVGATSVYLWSRHFYRSLQREIDHEQVNHASRTASVHSWKLQSIPANLIDSPDDFRILHEKDEKTISDLVLPDDRDIRYRLFTELLRRDMRCFTKMPQSWIMWLMLRRTELGHTFSQSHITNLGFEEGDVFCGVYRVSKRGDMKVEIEMVAPKGFPPLNGLLVIAVEAEKVVVLRTETLQWTNSASGAVLPLERPLLRFMHHVASWWLLVSGAKYLTALAELEK